MLDNGKFPGTERLKGRHCFDKFKKSRHFRGEYLRIALVPAPNTSQLPGRGIKIAFVVSKKFFNKAVDRNRIKRRLREIYRGNRGLLPSNVWLMVMAQPGAAYADFKTVEEDFKKLCFVIASKVNGNKDDKDL